MTFSATVVAADSVTYTAASGTAPTPVAIGSSVDPENCIVLHTVRTEGDTSTRMGRHSWTAEFVGDPATTIQFRRGEATDAKACTIHWQVVEFTNCTVQHLEISPTAITQHTNITGAIANQFLLSSMRSTNSTGTRPIRAALYLTDNAGQARVSYAITAGSQSAGDPVVRAQVITFPSGDIEFVEHGVVTLSSGSNGSITLASSIDTTKSLLRISSDPDGSAEGWARGNPSAVFAAATTDTINLTRDTTATSYAVDVHYSVMTLTGLVVRHGGFDPAAATSGTSSITSVDTARSVNLTPAFPAGNSYSNDNGAIEHDAMMDVWLSDATTVSWARGTGTNFTSHDVRYQVVQWPEAAAPGGGSGGNRLIMW